MMMKHNKKRNTAFLYEALILELTKSVISKDLDYRSQVKSIIYEFFNSNSILKRELDVYKELTDSKGLSEDMSQKLLDEAKNVYDSLNKKAISIKQTALIHRINKELKPSVFMNDVQGYTNMASIYQILNRKTPNIKTKIMLESKLKQEMSQPQIVEEVVNISENDRFIVPTAIKKFNEKYSNSELNSNQKELLSRFISLSENTFTDFILFSGNELERIQKTLSESLKKDESKEFHQDFKKALKIVEGFENSEVDLSFIKKLLKLQKLESEIIKWSQLMLDKMK